MRILLVGYGKMGKLIEELSIKKGHVVIGRISRENRNELKNFNSVNTDVAIEFTSPHSAFENVKELLEAGIPTVSGSTGWNEKLEEVKKLCKEKKGTFLHASNFSIGVNIFFEINRKLAQMMNSQPQYEVDLLEIHHTAKKDSPSGTAVTLAEGILQNLERKKSWTDEHPTQESILIKSERTDPAPGTHIVGYRSSIDDIEIMHKAHSREGFASGAITAAEFIKDRKGIYSMSDVLNF